MGSSFSQEVYESYSLELYEGALQQPCLLPDVGIDESLLEYSGLDSNAVLQVYSHDLLNQVPGYIEKLESGFGVFTSFPNAVGLGALVISMIMELCMKSGTQRNDNSYNMLRHVFGEEKASSVRDTMSEYLTRHRMFINNNRRLREEIHRLEKQLSNHLTILKNSLLHDGQMRTCGFKIWVNGASFHVQMLIHEARLSSRTGLSASDYVNAIEPAINVYLLDLDDLLEKYKTHKISSTSNTYGKGFCVDAIGCVPSTCVIANDDERDCRRTFREIRRHVPCEERDLINAYMNHVFSKYEPITGLKSHFTNIKSNINYLIRQHGSFTLPSAG